jgi:hypothetical protein
MALQDAGKTCVLVGETSEKKVSILAGLSIADVLRAEATQALRRRSASFERLDFY